MPEHKELYVWSLADAKRSGEVSLWHESHNENIACAEAIKQAINDNYSDYRLHECAKGVIEQYGFDRVNWVLANTVQRSMSDGRYSEDNKAWARGTYIPLEDTRTDFLVTAHPGLTNLFLDQARREWQSLGLFDRSHCISEKDGEIDYKDKVVVLNPNMLKDEYKTPDDQLFWAKGGFGCSPNSRGRKVFGEFLKDGADTHFYREDIIGVLKDEHLPEWAKEKLSESAVPEESEDAGMTMSGM